MSESIISKSSPQQIPKRRRSARLSMCQENPPIIELDFNAAGDSSIRRISTRSMCQENPPIINSDFNAADDSPKQRRSTRSMCQENPPIIDSGFNAAGDSPKRRISLSTRAMCQQNPPIIDSGFNAAGDSPKRRRSTRSMCQENPPIIDLGFNAAGDSPKRRISLSTRAMCQENPPIIDAEFNAAGDSPKRRRSTRSMCQKNPPIIDLGFNAAGDSPKRRISLSTRALCQENPPIIDSEFIAAGDSPKRRRSTRSMCQENPPILDSDFNVAGDSPKRRRSTRSKCQENPPIIDSDFDAAGELLKQRRSARLSMCQEHPPIIDSDFNAAGELPKRRRSAQLSMCQENPPVIDSDFKAASDPIVNVDVVETIGTEKSFCDENSSQKTRQMNKCHDPVATQPLCLPAKNIVAPGKTVDKNSNKDTGCSPGLDGDMRSLQVSIDGNVSLNIDTAARSKPTDSLIEPQTKPNSLNGSIADNETASEKDSESKSLAAVIDLNNSYVNLDDFSSIATITSNETVIAESLSNKLNETNNSNGIQMNELRTSTYDQPPSKPDTFRKRIAALCDDQMNFDLKRTKVNIFTECTGPRWYQVEGCTVTKPILSKKLIEAFSFFPNYGKPTKPSELPQFLDQKVQEFVGSGLTNDEFSKLQKLCSEDLLRKGNEPIFKMSLGSINQSFLTEDLAKNEDSDSFDDYKLQIIRKHKIRAMNDLGNTYTKKLKYRGVRIMPMPQPATDKASTSRESDLQPGQDLLFTVRLYRPFTFLNNRCTNKSRLNTRHSLFARTIVLHGRQRLAELRDRILCANDIDMRVDVSDRVDDPPLTTAKELFPSGFMFINNVFYVDMRPGCHDTSASIRQWAARRPGLAHFPVQDMAAVCVGDLVVRLGHPEVYMHQGNCEHLFTFSDIRLLSPRDPLGAARYPRHTAVTQYSTIYCTSCAEFPSKWITTQSDRVPFDPAFFCDTCLKLYHYKDGKKIGNFNVFSYRGNELTMLKPQG